DVPRVQQLRDAYVHHSDLRHELINEDNYLISPKKSGYRGIHLVYEYRSDRSGEHDGRKIEMQLRSRLQHAWATAVETVGMFSSQYLKSSRGDKQWLRFFALMGSCIALREKAPMVPGTPSNARQLYAELVELERALDVRRRLKAYGRALNVLGDDNAGYYFLLDLDTEKEVLKVMGFPKSGLLAAQEAYQRREKEVVGRPGRDTVLVSVDSVNHLRSAYPNFYLDTHLFTQALEFSLGQAAKKAT
ncbi:MAG TPA: RelA/SpoT domain-containing protein, partial [Polyangiaceae bacterium]|nr:RelA/SpoT domain-containing protein [Polyangiaceae bacterium]